MLIDLHRTSMRSRLILCPCIARRGPTIRTVEPVQFYAASDYVIWEEDMSTEMYFIVEGMLEVRVNVPVPATSVEPEGEAPRTVPSLCRTCVSPHASGAAWLMALCEKSAARLPGIPDTSLQVVHVAIPLDDTAIAAWQQCRDAVLAADECAVKHAHASLADQGAGGGSFEQHSSLSVHAPGPIMHVVSACTGAAQCTLRRSVLHFCRWQPQWSPDSH